MEGHRRVHPRRYPALQRMCSEQPARRPVPIRAFSIQVDYFRVCRHLGAILEMRSTTRVLLNLRNYAAGVADADVALGRVR